jgi:hypothetical protein
MSAPKYTFFEAITSSEVQKKEENRDMATRLITTPHDKFNQRIELTENLIKKMPTDKPEIKNALKEELEKMRTEKDNANPKHGM